MFNQYEQVKIDIALSMLRDAGLTVQYNMLSHAKSKDEIKSFLDYLLGVQDTLSLATYGTKYDGIKYTSNTLRSVVRDVRTLLKSVRDGIKEGE